MWYRQKSQAHITKNGENHTFWSKLSSFLIWSSSGCSVTGNPNSSSPPEYVWYFLNSVSNWFWKIMSRSEASRGATPSTIGPVWKYSEMQHEYVPCTFKPQQPVFINKWIVKPTKQYSYVQSIIRTTSNKERSLEHWKLMVWGNF